LSGEWGGAWAGERAWDKVNERIDSLALVPGSWRITAHSDVIPRTDRARAIRVILTRLSEEPLPLVETHTR